MSIYDRSTWPDPRANPLVLLFERGDHWYSNTEILTALGYEPRRSLISQWPTLAEQLGEGETAVRNRGLLVIDDKRQPRTGGLERYFSRKALIIIAMRAQSANAAAFCNYIADAVAAPKSTP